MRAQIFRTIRFLMVMGLTLGFSLGCSSSGNHSNPDTDTGAGAETGSGGNTGGGIAATEESQFSAPTDVLTQSENNLVASGPAEQTAALANFPTETP